MNTPFESPGHTSPTHDMAANKAADEGAVQRLFTQARTHAHWLPRPVPAELLHALVRLVQCGPTSMNCQPLRIRFVVSDEARARLLGCVNAGNVAKTQEAPVVAILGQDLAFPTACRSSLRTRPTRRPTTRASRTWSPARPCATAACKRAT